eukprot:COSAG04_NODE_12000_length_676_cov_1.440208_2_plen_101_part_01
MEADEALLQGHAQIPCAVGCLLQLRHRAVHRRAADELVDARLHRVDDRLRPGELREPRERVHAVEGVQPQLQQLRIHHCAAVGRPTRRRLPVGRAGIRNAA